MNLENFHFFLTSQGQIGTVTGSGNLSLKLQEPGYCIGSCCDFSQFIVFKLFSFRAMASGSAIGGKGRPLGLPSPIAPVQVGPELHPPMDLSLLDMVDEGLADLSVQPLSPKSKKLRDMEVYAKAQKN